MTKSIKKKRKGIKKNVENGKKDRKDKDKKRG